VVTAGGGAGALEVALAATEVVDWDAEVVVVTGALLVSLQPARSNSAAAAIAVRYLIPPTQLRFSWSPMVICRQAGDCGHRSRT
jgi:hypothetical protein